MVERDLVATSPARTAWERMIELARIGGFIVSALPKTRAKGLGARASPVKQGTAEPNSNRSRPVHENDAAENERDGEDEPRLHGVAEQEMAGEHAHQRA